MTAPPTLAAACCSPPATQNVVIRFDIDGDLRFLAHRDELRLLTRALTRAGWPVTYSRGFNPQPRVVLPLPRSVGMASACEWALIELAEASDLARLRQRLDQELPHGCRLRCVDALAAPAKPHPRRVASEVELHAPHAQQVALQLARVMAAATLSLARTHGPDRPTTAVDIRPYIETLSLEGCSLSMWLTFVGGRTARPIEVLTVLGLPAGEYNHRVRRTQVEWDTQLGESESPPSVERNNVAQAETHAAQTRQRQTPEEG